MAIIKHLTKYPEYNNNHTLQISNNIFNIYNYKLSNQAVRITSVDDSDLLALANNDCLLLLGSHTIPTSSYNALNSTVNGAVFASRSWGNTLLIIECQSLLEPFMGDLVTLSNCIVSITSDFIWIRYLSTDPKRIWTWWNNHLHIIPPFGFQFMEVSDQSEGPQWFGGYIQNVGDDYLLPCLDLNIIFDINDDVVTLSNQSYDTVLNDLGGAMFANICMNRSNLARVYLQCIQMLMSLYQQSLVEVHESRPTDYQLNPMEL